MPLYDALGSHGSLGLLVSDQTAAGGLITLDRHGKLTPDLVTHSTPLGRKTNYSVTTNSDGSEVYKVTDPAGIVSSTGYAVDGTATRSSADGTVVTETFTPDPRFGARCRSQR